MVGTMTCVLARTDLLPRISRVMIGYFACGRFGVLGNKGACGVRLRLRTSTHKHKVNTFVPTTQCCSL